MIGSDWELWRCLKMVHVIPTDDVHETFITLTIRVSSLSSTKYNDDEVKYTNSSQAPVEVECP
jgi:hypothetical protein